jgi:hypothetical protein
MGQALPRALIGKVMIGLGLRNRCNERSGKPRRRQRDQTQGTEQQVLPGP